MNKDRLCEQSEPQSYVKGKHLVRFDNIHPLPIGFQDILPEKLQAIPINLNDAPGMGVNQLGKIAFQVFDG